MRMEAIDFTDSAEKAQHLRAIEALCSEFPERREAVAEYYADRLRELMPEVTIRSYLSIFITRELRDRMRTPAVN